MVLRHPPLLGYDLETNLKPTIELFADGIRQAPPNDHEYGGGVRGVGGVGGDGSSDGDGGSGGGGVDRRLARFLVESPALLEYNVQKRLRPRLDRVSQLIEENGQGEGGHGGDEKSEGEDGHGAPRQLDEASLCAIATLTDSKFETWLSSEDRRGDGSGAGGERQREERRGGRGGAGRDEGLDGDGDGDGEAAGVERSPLYIVVSNLQRYLPTLAYSTPQYSTPQYSTPPYSTPHDGNALQPVHPALCSANVPLQHSSDTATPAAAATSAVS